MGFPKKSIVTLVVLSLLAVSIPALADEPAATPAPAPADNKIGIAIGLKMDLGLVTKYSDGGSQDGVFGFGLGLTSDYTLPFFKYVHAGIDFMWYTVGVDAAGTDRDNMIVLGPRFMGCYPLNDIGPFKAIVPYVFLSLGLSAYIPSHGDNKTGFWVAGGGGGELIFNFMNGALGAFMELGGMGNIYTSPDNKFSAFLWTFGAKYHL